MVAPMNMRRSLLNVAVLDGKISSRGGGGGTPYNGLYGEAPPERGTFFSLQVYKRVGISQV